MQTLIVCLLKTHFLHLSLIVKSQQNRIELVTRPVQNPSLVMTTHPRALKELSKPNVPGRAHIGMTEPLSHLKIHRVGILIQFLPREPILNQEAHGNFPRGKVTSLAVAATGRSPGNLAVQGRTFLRPPEQSPLEPEWK